VRTPAPVMRRFWTMLAHYHGQTWNASEIGRSLGQSDKTVASYLDTLTETWMVRRLQPWFENVGKRQVKAPKLYLRDSGILHSLLVLADLSQIAGHPKVGASWEGFAMEQVLTLIDPPQAYFWSVHAGAEIDLLLLDRGQRIGIEFKYSEAPTVTRSMRAAAETLRLGRLWIVTPGNGCYPLEPDVTVCGLASFSDAWRTAVTGA
jgi:uncharacterized protein